MDVIQNALLAKLQEQSTLEASLVVVKAEAEVLRQKLRQLAKKIAAQALASSDSDDSSDSDVSVADFKAAPQQQLRLMDAAETSDVVSRVDALPVMPPLLDEVVVPLVVAAVEPLTLDTYKSFLIRPAKGKHCGQCYYRAHKLDGGPSHTRVLGQCLVASKKRRGE